MKTFISINSIAVPAALTVLSAPLFVQPASAQACLEKPPSETQSAQPSQMQQSQSQNDQPSDTTPTSVQLAPYSGETYAISTAQNQDIEEMIPILEEMPVEENQMDTENPQSTQNTQETLDGQIQAQEDQEVFGQQTMEVTGEVTRVEENLIALNTDQGVQEFAVPQNVDVMRDATQASLEEIQPGDTATVLQTDAGQIVEVRATSQAVDTAASALLPLLLAGLVGAGLLYYLRRNQQTASRTTNEPRRNP